mmetsp:Transcript_12579/g.34406  ORF Transcript_12579/g.34406 Transcript_12579/m.34406 type:complete len:225 (-) Transcript_12579:41-715(-)
MPRHATPRARRHCTPTGPAPTLRSAEHAIAHANSTATLTPHHVTSLDDAQEGRQLHVLVHAVLEEDAQHARVAVDGHLLAALVHGAEGAVAHVRQVDAYVVPAALERQRQRRALRLHARDGLLVGGREAAHLLLVVHDQELEREELAHVLDVQHEVGQLTSAGDLEARLGAKDLHHVPLHLCVLQHVHLVHLAQLIVLIELLTLVLRRQKRREVVQARPLPEGQ